MSNSEDNILDVMHEFELLGVIFPNDSEDLVKSVLLKLIENQHKKTKNVCFDAINQLDIKDVSCNPDAGKWIDLSLRHAQDIVNSVKFDDE